MEQPFLDGSDDQAFPRLAYLEETRSWLFGISRSPRPVPSAAMVVRGYLLGPVDGPIPLADGRPLVELAPPDELADLLAGAEMLNERDGRYVAGGGDWFQLHRIDADHALLVGCDVEDTETDLLAAVPEWWADLVRTRHSGAFSTGTGFDRSTSCAGVTVDSGPTRSARPTRCCCTTSSNPTRTPDSSAVRLEHPRPPATKGGRQDSAGYC